MSETTDITVTLRIPGNWDGPESLLAQIPEGYHLTPETLTMPDGTEVEFNPLPADDQFPTVFRSSLRRPATAAELQVVDNYTVNACLTGTAGSMESAQKIMQAGAALIQAGGAGVFIDNCALAHGAGNWLYMLDEGSPDAISFAFVGIIRGKQDVRTVGMQIAGLQDVIMRRADADENEQAIIEVIRYCFTHDQPIGDGHLLADENGPRFRAETTSHDEFQQGTPMHNPFGRLRLVSMKDMAQRN